MRRRISYIRLGFLPVLLLALLIQMSCDDGGEVRVSKYDSTSMPPTLSRSEIAKPAPDATIIDSLTHDFGGVWVADSTQISNSSGSDGVIGFCRNGRIRYQVFDGGPVIRFTARQVWIDRQHAHIDMFLESMEGTDVTIAEAAMPVKGKLFATGDLLSDSRMKVLWYPRDFIAAIREKGSATSPEAFPAMFYYTGREPDCR